jgi:hypothetical protein
MYTAAQSKSLPKPEIFYVVRQTKAAIVTVLHEVPPGAEELASFDSPCGAIDFAELTVRELQASGERIEFVDPPNGLVGTG